MTLASPTEHVWHITILCDVPFPLVKPALGTRPREWVDSETIVDSHASSGTVDRTFQLEDRKNHIFFHYFFNIFLVTLFLLRDDAAEM